MLADDCMAGMRVSRVIDAFAPRRRSGTNRGRKRGIIPDYHAPASGVGLSNCMMVSNTERGDHDAPPELAGGTAGGPDYASMLRAVAAGDRSAEAALLRALLPPLRLVLHRRFGDDIDDLQQETLLIVLASAREGRIQEPQALVYFTLETARRLVANASRKQQRQRTDIDDEAIGRLATSMPAGDELLERADARRLVRDVLLNLPNARDREILQRYYLDEEPSDSLRARFSMDSMQLGRLLHRARQRFGDAWRRRRHGPATDE